jgi:hypothetical protein
MVGGVVIGVSRKDGQAHVHVADCPHYPKHGQGDECPRPDTCCVYTDEIKVHGGNRVEVKVGDPFWWQSGHCYWTPKENRGKPNARGGADYDIKLSKLGYSH